MAYPNKYTDAQVEVLGEVGAAKQRSATTTSANIVLTSTTRRVSIKAVGADMRYVIGDPEFNTATPPVAQIQATTTSHYIADGERLDFACPEGSAIAVETVSGTGALEITELV
jgi:hypothetical protein